MKMVSIRFPDGIHDQLTKEVKKKNTTISAYIKSLVCEKLNSEIENSILEKTKLYSQISLQLGMENRRLCSKLIQLLDTEDFEETLNKLKKESTEEIDAALQMLNTLKKD